MRAFLPTFLLAAAGLSLAGCYLDHRPNPTVEDRFYADEVTRREMDGVKVRPATLAEYAAVTGAKTDAVAFELKLDNDESYRVLLFAKSRDVKTGESGVTPLRSDTASEARKATLVAVFSGGSAKIAITGAKVEPDGYPIENVLPAGAIVDPAAIAVNLPPLGDAVRRFVVRRAQVAGVSDHEIECLVIPADKPASPKALASAIAAEWSKTK